MLQWFIRFTEFSEFLFHLGKTILGLDLPFVCVRPKENIPRRSITMVYAKGTEYNCKQLFFIVWEVLK